MIAAECLNYERRNYFFYEQYEPAENQGDPLEVLEDINGMIVTIK